MRLSEQLENLERDVAAEKTLGSDRNETAPWVFGWWVDVGGVEVFGPGCARINPGPTINCKIMG
jgi:hypothetical protein